MQITPQTAAGIAHRSGGTQFVTGDLSDPEINISYGSYYLRYLLDLYNGNEVAALAAYNAGTGNADAWGGASSEWTRSGSPRHAPTSRKCSRSGSNTGPSTPTTWGSPTRARNQTSHPKPLTSSGDPEPGLGLGEAAVAARAVAVADMAGEGVGEGVPVEAVGVLDTNRRSARGQRARFSSWRRSASGPGTPAPKVRAKRAQPPLVELGDHLAHVGFVRLPHARDLGHRVLARRGEQDPGSLAGREVLCSPRHRRFRRLPSSGCSGLTNTDGGRMTTSSVGRMRRCSTSQAGFR